MEKRTYIVALLLSSGLLLTGCGEETAGSARPNVRGIQHSPAPAAVSTPLEWDQGSWDGVQWI